MNRLLKPFPITLVGAIIIWLCGALSCEGTRWALRHVALK